MFPNKFVIFWDRQPVGLDKDSGGYPYKCNNPNSVKYWDSESEALKYMDSWPEREWIVKEIQFRIVG